MVIDIDMKELNGASNRTSEEAPPLESNVDLMPKAASLSLSSHRLPMHYPFLRLLVSDNILCSFI